MRKLYLMISLLAIGVLTACTPQGVIDLDIFIMDELITENSITVHAVISERITKLDDLTEIAYSVVSQTYEAHFNLIQTKSYTLTILFYPSESDYKEDNPMYGSITFDINKDMQTPGLSLKTNNLKTK